VTDALGRFYAPNASSLGVRGSASGSESGGESGGESGSESGGESGSERGSESGSERDSERGSESGRLVPSETDDSWSSPQTQSPPQPLQLLNQTAFFLETGYYLKAFGALAETESELEAEAETRPSKGSNANNSNTNSSNANSSSTTATTTTPARPPLPRLFVMCTNTILGKSNPRQVGPRILVVRISIEESFRNIFSF
jgi:hypothetical protein